MYPQSSYYTTNKETCRCGKGYFLIDRCEQPGFRSRDIFVYCDTCTEDDYLKPRTYELPPEHIKYRKKEGE